jgi:hypothetical protein
VGTGTSDIGQALKVSNQEKMFDEEKKMTLESPWHSLYGKLYAKCEFLLEAGGNNCRSRIRYSLGLFWGVESFSSIVRPTVRIHIIL